MSSPVAYLHVTLAAAAIPTPIWVQAGPMHYKAFVDREYSPVIATWEVGAVQLLPFTGWSQHSTRTPKASRNDTM